MYLEWLESLQRKDDVDHPSFQKHILFCGIEEGNINLGPDLTRHLQQNGIIYHTVEISTSGPQIISPEKFTVQCPIPEGPYLLSGRQLRPIYRLYDDTHGACLEALQPSQHDGQEVCPWCDETDCTKGAYVPLHVPGEEPQTFCIAVPSRRQTWSSLNMPSALAGKRVLIKDIFDMHGLRVSACNRAYLDMSFPNLPTAPMIGRLTEAGAVLVGKAKLSSMISREEPWETLDYNAPYNPRGDGYQSPAGSSSGSAAAIAAYEWLDYAVGSDCRLASNARMTLLTPASDGKCKATSNGEWLFRHTHIEWRSAVRWNDASVPVSGSIARQGRSLKGHRLLDTPSVFTRDLRQLKHFVQQWCKFQLDDTMRVWDAEAVFEHRPTADSKQPPTSIVVLDDYRLENEEQNIIFQDFVRDVSACFGVRADRSSLQESWDITPPDEASGQSLHCYLHNAGRHSFFYEFYHSNDDFRRRYQEKHHGTPPVALPTQMRWTEGQTITKQQRDHAIYRILVYRKWLERTLFSPDSSTVVVLPIMDAKVMYRDCKPAGETCGGPYAQDAWDQLWLAPVLGAPEITVPSEFHAS